MRATVDNARVKRLACFGWVSEDSGSVASADYILLRELLRRGIEVDLYAEEDHNPLPTGLVGPGFRYFGLARPPGLRRLETLPSPLPGALRAVFSPWVGAAWSRAYSPVVNAEHRSSPYDAVLSLGTAPAFEIEGVPTVAWLQSPFHTELEAIRRLRSQFVVAGARAYYLALNAYYRYVRKLREAAVASSCDALIVPSEWSRSELLAAGSPVAEVHALPYPIDLDLFSPDDPPAIDPKRPVLLSLGRLVPRKRLDLLLDAFALIVEDCPAARLRIIGRRGYLSDPLTLIERFPYRDKVEYRPSIPRCEVPNLFRQTGVLMQVSENENFGSSVAEAIACGVPVVVGPSNGTGEYVDGYSQVFDSYEPRCVAEATHKVLAALVDRPEAVRQSTRATAERRFSPENVAEQLLRIVEATVAARART